VIRAGDELTGGVENLDPGIVVALTDLQQIRQPRGKRKIRRYRLYSLSGQGTCRECRVGQRFHARSLPGEWCPQSDKRHKREQLSGAEAKP
jgi:hypothetical protein